MPWLENLVRKVAAFRQCERGGRHDWCTKLREMELFRELADTTVAEMCGRMEAVAVCSGDLIIREGEEGDYYYVLADGQAEVMRKSAEPKAPPKDDTSEEVISWTSGHEPKAKAPKARSEHGPRVAELTEGCGFGEEALISNNRRNATVRMTTDGTVLRLSRHDFDELLKEPQLHWFSLANASSEVARGAKWLDVRSIHDKCLEGTLPGTLRLPIEDLRIKACTLSRDSLYICYCTNARLSASAAFVLTQMGYRVGVLQGGLRSLR